MDLVSLCLCEREQKSDNINEGEDHISELPDEILVSILSLLQMSEEALSHGVMREQARTSVLSYRWKRLWLYIPNLNFENRWTEKLEFINWVNQVVKSYQGSILDKFRICFDLDESNSLDVDAWVTFALEKRVKRLELDLRSTDGIIQRTPGSYTFPRICGIPYSRCNSLTFLSLAGVQINDEAISYLLLDCPNLESLRVSESLSLVNLSFVGGPSLKMKYLEISICLNLYSIEISAEKLVSFKYQGRRISISFKDAPQLVELHINGDILNHTFRQLCSNLSRLESLSLHSLWLSETIESFRVPKLYNLKHMKFTLFAHDEDSLLGFAPLIEACPSLCTFTMELTPLSKKTHGRQREPIRDMRCSLQSLKVIEIVGFVCRAIDLEIALYLIDSASSIEKVIFDTRPSLFSAMPFGNVNTKSRTTVRKRAKKIDLNLPQGAELIII